MFYKRSKVIGHVAVDSGQLLVTDPCYLGDFKSDEFTDKEWYTIQYDNQEPEVISVCSKRWFEVVDDINEKRVKVINIRKESNELPYDYSYSGCCRATLSSEDGGCNVSQGKFEHAGVAFQTGYGDGVYPVRAYYNKDNRIMQIEINFE